MAASAAAAENLVEELRALLVEVSDGKLQAGNIDPAANLFDFGYVDSLSGVMFLARIEEQWGVAHRGLRPGGAAEHARGAWPPTCARVARGPREDRQPLHAARSRREPRARGRHARLAARLLGAPALLAPHGRAPLGAAAGAARARQPGLPGRAGRGEVRRPRAPQPRHLPPARPGRGDRPLARHLPARLPLPRAFARSRRSARRCSRTRCCPTWRAAARSRATRRPSPAPARTSTRWRRTRRGAAATGAGGSAATRSGSATRSGRACSPSSRTTWTRAAAAAGSPPSRCAPTSRASRLGRELPSLGMRGVVQGEVAFDDVLVDADHVVGEPKRGLEVGVDSMSWSRFAIAATCVGTLRRSVAAARALRGAARDRDRPADRPPADAHRARPR